MNAARKVVFSRTLRTAEWANTGIAAGDTTEEIDKLRRGGDGEREREPESRGPGLHTALTTGQNRSYSWTGSAPRS